jgi:hypothetical protein
MNERSPVLPSTPLHKQEEVFFFFLFIQFVVGSNNTNERPRVAYEEAGGRGAATRADTQAIRGSPGSRRRRIVPSSGSSFVLPFRKGGPSFVIYGLGASETDRVSFFLPYHVLYRRFHTMYYIVVISHIIFIEQNFKGNACCLQSFC